MDNFSTFGGRPTRSRLAAAGTAALCLAWAASALAATSATTRRSGDPLRVVAFYSPTCAGCEDVKRALIASEARWGGRIRVERRRLDDRQGFRDFIAYENHYESVENKTPKVFLGGSYLVGAKEIAARLDAIIELELAGAAATFGTPPPTSAPAGAQPEQEPPAVLERIAALGPAVVIVAGLMDGVNPCAFATIVFMVSMLAYLGRTRRQVAVVGLGFTAAVFVTYFLLGMGLLWGVKAFSVSHGISKNLARVVAMLAFGLAGWSLVDLVRYLRSGDVKKMTLGLPKAVSSRIHKVIRVGLSTGGLLAGAVTVGLLVAVLESLCTGQAYLPTIVYMVRSPGLRTSALAYLLLYNLMFILPLVVVFLVTYFGVSSERLAALLTRHLAALKLGMALLFIALGVLVLATI